MRYYRELNNTTKQRISQALRGRSKTDTHKEAISNSMKKYWAAIPSKGNVNNKEGDNEKDM